ncbi:MAG: rRNA maturation RNase YbeY [Clostridia bacterium]|nr:rRNA maturation RNase YbeY [Clostridia bacterium]
MIKVLLNNKTGKAFDRKTLSVMKKVICYAIEAEHPDIEGEVSLTLCDNEYIRELNSEFRGIDAPTDVLSFPTLDFDMGGYTIIGDIIISLERATAQAEEYGHSLLRELCFLSVHSALHLLGYDHVDDEEGRIYMEKRQEEVLLHFGIGR